MKIAYKILRAQDASVLGMMATDEMESGWVPLGAPFIAASPGQTESRCYQQAMTLPEHHWSWSTSKKES